MEDKDPIDPAHVINDIGESLARQLEMRSELLRLEALEIGSKAMGHLFALIVSVTLAFFTVVFVSILIGFSLSECLHSRVYGFGIIAFMYVLAFVLALTKYQSWLVAPVANRIIRAMQSEDESTDE
jgi:hypothetical protein